ncbi:hypothetical protein [Roseivirga pacifica]
MKKELKLYFNQLTKHYWFEDHSEQKKHRIKSHFFCPIWHILNLQSHTPVKFKTYHKGYKPEYKLIPTSNLAQEIQYKHEPPHAIVFYNDIKHTIAFHQYQAASLIANEEQIGSIENLGNKNINLLIIQFRIKYIDELDLPTIKKLCEIFLVITKFINHEAALSQFAATYPKFEELKPIESEWFD